jgi:hypothetical protein
MKKGTLIGLVFLVGLFFSFSVGQAGSMGNPGMHNQPAGDFNTKFGMEKFIGGKPGHSAPVVIPGVYESQAGDFTTKFWKEKFIGGGPGQPGNVLMAIGQGFVFQNAVLESVEVYGKDGWDYKTTYTGGMLTLNSTGPWLKKGMLKARNLTAYNYSTVDGEGDLHFQLLMTGSFDNAAYSFDIVVTYDGTPETYQIKYDANGDFEFQMGVNYNVKIEIYETL